MRDQGGQLEVMPATSECVVVPKTGDAGRRWRWGLRLAKKIRVGSVEAKTCRLEFFFLLCAPAAKRGLLADAGQQASTAFKELGCEHQGSQMQKGSCRRRDLWQRLDVQRTCVMGLVQERAVGQQRAFAHVNQRREQPHHVMLDGGRTW